MARTSNIDMKRLISLRESGMTQAQIAQAMGISQPAVSLALRKGVTKSKSRQSSRGRSDYKESQVSQGYDSNKEGINRGVWRRFSDEREDLARDYEALRAHILLTSAKQAEAFEKTWESAYGQDGQMASVIEEMKEFCGVGVG